MKKVTILIPCYNEEKSLPLLWKEISKVISTNTQYLWEVLFVNDGSKDSTLLTIKDLRRGGGNNLINYIDLSRNFGKEAAMLAGFDYAKGNCVIIIDADLQHPPTLIPEMLKYWEDGYDDVYAKRITRGKESWLRKKLSLAFYYILQKSTKVEILQNVGDFRLLDRKCIDTLKKLRETQRYTKGMFCWIGFNKKEITFEQGNRVAGSTSWNFKSLFNLAIEGITSFTTAPLRIATIIGLIVSLVTFIYAIIILLKTIIWGEEIQGFPTLAIIILFLGGTQLLSLGIIGEYLARIFHETKKRPVYVIKEYKGE